MAIFIRCDHLADRFDLSQRQLLWRTSRARGAIVEVAWRLATPDVVSGAGQTRDAEHGAQSELRFRPVDRLQQPRFGCAVRQPDSSQGEARELEQQRHQPQQGHEAVNAKSERNDLLSQADGVLVDSLQRHDRRCRRREPASRRGSRHSMA
jgi:hypothetical protein